MDDLGPLALSIFVVATFLGALVAGLAGFAFGLVAASLWLYVVTPVESAVFIVSYGLIVQGLAVWRLRQSLDWRRLWPFLLGGAIGVPAGVAILTVANPAHVRRAVGVVLVLYSLNGLFRPARIIAGGGAAADLGVGVLNGIMGGVTGLGGILTTIWCGLRGWPRDVQRAVFQPTTVFVFLLSALSLGAKGAIGAATLKLFVIGLPALFLGVWLGLKLYGRLDEAAFRRVVLVLLLVSGVALIV